MSNAEPLKFLRCSLSAGLADREGHYTYDECVRWLIADNTNMKAAADEIERLEKVEQALSDELETAEEEGCDYDNIILENNSLHERVAELEGQLVDAQEGD